MAVIKGVEHIGICAKDTAALKDWYVQNLDAKVVYDNKKSPPTFFIQMEEGSLIEFYPATSDGNQANEPNPMQGVRHLALTTQDFEAAVKRFTDLNCPVVTPATVTDAGIGTFFFRDPEGNILHLISRKTPLV